MTMVPKEPCFDCPYVSKTKDEELYKAILKASTEIQDQPKVEVRTRSWTKKIGTVEIPMSMHEVFVDNQALDMGEGGASVDTYECSRHGETPHIGGYNQGGYDGMSVCIKCVVEVHKHLETKKDE